MAPILDPRAIGVLERFAASNVLLALDYDGTLAPIVETPQRARMRLATRRLLASVARCYPCVVISGRALDDVSRRLGNSTVWAVFGNHGFEPSPAADPRHLSLVQTWVDELRRRLASEDGIVIEDKTHTATVHFRRAADPLRARRRIQAAVASLAGARIIEGAACVNLLPSDGPDKGAALRSAQRQFACDTAIYIGDDGTDEPAFWSGDATQLLSIRVGWSASSTARHYLHAQRDIDQLLATLLTLRRQWLACDPVRWYPH